MDGIVDYSWEHAANPDNTKWKPGYRFWVWQHNSRTLTSTMRRRYRVYFRIGKDGTLEWTGGVKALPATLAGVRAMYEEGRPTV